MKNFFTHTRRLLYLLLGAPDILLGHRLPIVILCYHSVSNDSWLHSISLKQFHSQIQYLSHNYKFISLSQLAKNRHFSSPVAAITFDDGYKDILIVAPLLKKYHIRPTVFVLSDTAHANRKELENHKEFLSISDLKALLRQGWEIGSHSATHPNLSSIPVSQITAEIVKSKKDLEKCLKTPIRYFAYPKSKFTPTVLSVVKSAGYLLGFSWAEPSIRDSSDPYRLARISPNSTYSMTEFKATLTPTLDSISYLVKKSAQSFNLI